MRNPVGIVPFRAKISWAFGSPLCMKMREAPWSAVACYRFSPGQLAEFVEGRSLREVLEDGALPPEHVAGSWRNSPAPLPRMVQ
jgi:hypothetical protein